MNEKTPVETKKPYKPPVLSEYGDIRQTTQNTLNGSKRTDNVRNPKTLP
jgi:hypothetical protein